MEIGETIRFNYTGNVQTYTITDSGLYQLDVYGASNGGHSLGYKVLRRGTVLYICCGGVGGEGITPAQAYGGYNGGGSGVGENWANQTGSGGGGATHIALVDGTLATIGKQTFDEKGMIVAGGGGGFAVRVYGSDYKVQVYNGGYGGGTNGGNGHEINEYAGSTYYGVGGTQVSGGSNDGCASGLFGLGGSGNGSVVGGGGGGYFGGSSGSRYPDYSSGGGGSGWIGGVPTITFKKISYSPSMQSNANSGNGYATLKFIDKKSALKMGDRDLSIYFGENDITLHFGDNDM